MVQRSIEPVYEIEANRIGDGCYVRVTFADGKTETVYGFKSDLAAAKWIRCEAVGWLWQKRIEQKQVAS